MARLIIEKIRFKNILSYGEMWTEFNLNRSNHVTVITAKNGHGKSTITDALSLCLFNKPIRKSKKPNMVNRRNKKNALIETYFSVDDDKYMVRRGIKPDVFEIYKNDFTKALNQDASSRDYQKILENNILKMNYTTFTQSIIISKTLYTPFMTLVASKRREFVENILRLKVFSNMAKLHKDNFDKLKSEYLLCKSDIDKVSIKIDEQTKSLDNIKAIIQSNLDDKTKFINSQINEKNEVINKLVASYKDYESKLKKLDNSIVSTYNTTLTTLSKLESKLDDLKSLNFDGKTCSLCGTEYSKEHIDQHKLDNDDKINKVEIAISQTTDKLNNLKALYDTYNEDLIINNDINNELAIIKKQLVSIKSDVNKLTNELNLISTDTSSIDTIKSILDSNIEKKLELTKNYDILTDNLNDATIVTNMLKDGGAKSIAINQSIPLINTLINKNLSDFGFFVKFELDSEFNEKILVRGFEEAAYNDFSEGEKLRIDMAILLAWRDLSLLQNSMSCNLLFFDEITDASMDDEGTDIFAKMLTTLKDNNVFIITHKPEKLDNIARSTITIIKKDGYSQIKK